MSMGPAILPLLRPTELVAPEIFSYSSLQQMRVCARRWQLLHARYGELTGYPEPFHPAAERGRLVHLLVSAMFRAMAAAGNPAPGTPSFVAASRRLNALALATSHLARAQQKLAANPRQQGQRLTLSPIDLYSAACVVFRQEYRPSSGERPVKHPTEESADHGGKTAESLRHRLARRGSLSEERLQHPSLPLHGFVDLVLHEQGAVIVELKTGLPQPSHHEQVRLYALLWWRQEGELPVRGEVRYGTRAEPLALDAPTLERLEQSLAEEIALLRQQFVAEAPATLGEHCWRCPVRAACEPYWQMPAGQEEWVDAALEVEGVDALGVRAQNASGQAVRVILPSGAEELRGHLVPGLRTRWLNVRQKEVGVLEFTPRTEIFSLASE